MILVYKYGGSAYAVTTMEKFRKQFDRNLQNCPNGWAASFESFEACVKAWFW